MSMDWRQASAETGVSGALSELCVGWRGGTAENRAPAWVPERHESADAARVHGGRGGLARQGSSEGVVGWRGRVRGGRGGVGAARVRGGRYAG